MNKEFQQRHIGPSEYDIKNMLSVLGCASLEEAVKKQFLNLFILAIE